MIIEIKKTDYPILMDIWESAVLNTHDFLKQEDFLYYKEHLPAYFQYVYLQPIITQYFIDNKSEIWLLFLIAHSKR